MDSYSMRPVVVAVVGNRFGDMGAGLGPQFLCRSRLQIEGVGKVDSKAVAVVAVVGSIEHLQL